MPTVIVYQYEHFDRLTRMFSRGPGYATKEAIDAMNAVVLSDTGVEVDASHVNAAGRYVGPAFDD